MQRHRHSRYNRSIQRMAVLACGGPLLALAGPASAVTSPGATAAAAGAPAYFHTVPPGTKLPTGGQCATWVRARPMRENKGVNRAYNRATGQPVSKTFFSGDKSQANQWIAPRINGNFTGTTAEILRWAACKWGIDQNMVFAQAAIESWWRQTTKGDWESSGCPPGHGTGVDGRAGLCPQSWGSCRTGTRTKSQAGPVSPSPRP